MCGAGRAFRYNFRNDSLQCTDIHAEAELQRAVLIDRAVGEFFCAAVFCYGLAPTD